MPNPPTEVVVEKVLSEPGEPWGGDGGKSRKRTYEEVLFQGEGQSRKAYVDEDVTLADGATVKGWFNNQKGTWSIVGDGPPQNGGGGGSQKSQQTLGGGGGGGYNDAKTVARISRSHSQEMALRFIAASGDVAGMDLSNNETVDSYQKTVLKPLVDWFDRDKAQAGESAS